MIFYCLDKLIENSKNKIKISFLDYHSNAIKFVDKINVILNRFIDSIFKTKFSFFRLNIAKNLILGQDLIINLQIQDL